MRAQSTNSVMAFEIVENIIPLPNNASRKYLEVAQASLTGADPKKPFAHVRACIALSSSFVGSHSRSLPICTTIGYASQVSLVRRGQGCVHGKRCIRQSYNHRAENQVRCTHRFYVISADSGRGQRQAARHHNSSSIL
jgi:hypothetical protein